MGKVWTEARVKLLIKTIQKHEQIWNTKHPDFTRNKRVRHKFWQEVTKLFNESPNDKKFKLNELCTKWNNLRINFEKECKKNPDSSRWRYFSRLKFLEHHPSKKHEILPFDSDKKYCLRTSINRDYQVDNETDISVGSISPRVNQREDFGQEATTLEKYSNEICMNEGNDSGESIKNVTHTGYEVNKVDRQWSFGNFIASELMPLEMDLQIRAKKIIFDVLMDLQCEQQQRSNLEF